ENIVLFTPYIFLETQKYSLHFECSSSLFLQSHTCGELRPAHVGEEVTLWLDFSGLAKMYLKKALCDLHPESVIRVKGTARLQPDGQENKEMPTGEVEVLAESVEILNVCHQLPCEIKDFVKYNLRLRSQLVMKIRDDLCYVHGGLWMLKTPTLFKRTPWGAKKFVVPSREPGQFYSLPQSLQQFKQHLMVAVIDRYFQLARCYRDEGSKPDRQPEFTQGLVQYAWPVLVGSNNLLLLLRFVGQIKIGCNSLLGSVLYTQCIRTFFISIQKHLKSKDQEPLKKTARSQFNQVCLPHVLKNHAAFTVRSRPLLGKAQASLVFHFLWVVDFPLFLPKEDDPGQLDSAHHPFTAPLPEDTHLLYSQSHSVHGQHYDLVLNRCEIGGGFILILKASEQQYVLEIILKDDPSLLSHLLEALDSGAHPHGGIAWGLDHLVSIIVGTPSIRDVIAFPKSFRGNDLMSHAPDFVSENQRKPYHISVKWPADGEGNQEK
uniref:Aspartyl-tRNA synthetase 2, mitochondrial n=1 Tax=Salmo trutta TaxID=8032 RepID=A0A674C2J7_SALTR